MDDDIDISLLEDVFNEVDVPLKKPSFLAELAKQDEDIALGKIKEIEAKNVGKEKVSQENSIIHSGETDSSEDEDNRYFEDRQLSESGRNLQNILRSSHITTSLHEERNVKLKKWKNEKVEKLKDQTPVSLLTNGTKLDVSRDPVFNMRIINPVVSSQVISQKMIGRIPIPTAKIKSYLLEQDVKNVDWVTGGAILAKSVRTSQKGNQYCIWNLSDLHGEIKTISVFLFGTAYKEFWKTSIGMVVGFLNPVPMESKDSKIEATLKVDNAQKVLLFGSAKDYGICKSKRKNGEPCSSVVNLSICEYCIYHVKQEYQKSSRRTELQSSCAGRGLNTLRNKVLGKNEVFYGGKSFMAIPGKKTTKQVQKDEARLKQLNSNKIDKYLKAKDNETLEKLSETSNKKSPEAGKLRGAENRELMKNLHGTNIFTSPKTPSTSQNKIQTTLFTPKPKETDFIDLDKPISRNQKNIARANALKYIKQNGPIKNSESALKEKKTPEQVNKLKRKIEEEFECETKKQKIGEETEKTPKTAKDLLQEKRLRYGITDEFLKLMNEQPKNKALLNVVESEEQEKYFQKLEIREKMEEKMLSTYKIECKVVRCLKCNYKSFSASDLCKQENHPLKVVNGFKRFWKCGDCSARTVCLELVPLHSCKVCGSSRWEKTTMMKEKTAQLKESLSLRGHEEGYVGATVHNANLNLLVPD